MGIFDKLFGKKDGVTQLVGDKKNQEALIASLEQEPMRECSTVKKAFESSQGKLFQKYLAKICYDCEQEHIKKDDDISQPQNIRHTPKKSVRSMDEWTTIIDLFVQDYKKEPEYDVKKTLSGHSDSSSVFVDEYGEEGEGILKSLMNALGSLQAQTLLKQLFAKGEAGARNKNLRQESIFRDIDGEVSSKSIRRDFAYLYTHKYRKLPFYIP